jgi:hypothetical protein
MVKTNKKLPKVEIGVKADLRVQGEVEVGDDYILSFALQLRKKHKK